MLFGSRATLVEPASALPGRSSPVLPHPAAHAVLGSPLTGPYPDGTAELYIAAGCFWGVEELLWPLPGIVTTSVGYMGGFTPNPTYEEVCTGMTGHTETVHVAYDPRQLSTHDILKVFWEHHDPTQGYRQGNDIGTQYRSALFWTTPDQHAVAEATRAAFQRALDEHGYGAITTQIASASGLPYYLAEDYHQQYLHKNPHGYRCHATTGLELPTS